MKKALRRIGAILLWIVIAALLAPVVVPPFLDRIYYCGPVSDHYDGHRFFNPDGEAGWSGGGFPTGRMLRFGLGAGRTPWPASVPVRQTVPYRSALGRDTCAPAEGRLPVSPATPTSPPLRITWIGHATVLVQVGGLNILTDPVWSDRTGPFGRGPQRVRVPGVRFADLPKIDLILISHNHYDHLDLPTLRRLWARDRPLIVTGLGNDVILAGAGIRAVTGDWGQTVDTGLRLDISCTAFSIGTVKVTIEPVHHWGSRWFADRDRALWSGFRILLPGGDVFFAGDTGYGDGRWVEAAAKGAPIRLAILPIGAYRPRALMARNHVDPPEAVTIFKRLHAASALAVHWGTFPLAAEGVDEAPLLLRHTLRMEGIAPDRFRAPEPGVAWDVPPLPR